ncbi:hypothetical protein LWI28_015069 [Acer negundo]|uniref:Protein kinase domain-containing protein n=1 Tax=Acer negundo TaxID=4023 RepID=A0AAD5JAC1_ACENE|nr:hypothetical protein LWI28_015069 [Acer negundo]
MKTDRRLDEMTRRTELTALGSTSSHDPPNWVSGTASSPVVQKVAVFRESLCMLLPCFSPVWFRSALVLLPVPELLVTAGRLGTVSLGWTSTVKWMRKGSDISRVSDLRRWVKHVPSSPFNKSGYLEFKISLGLSSLVAEQKRVLPGMVEAVKQVASQSGSAQAGQDCLFLFETARTTTITAANNTTWRIFSYKELHTATSGFSEENKLGEGGFGSVYWGKTSDGLQIAVKKLKAMNSKAEMEFAVEVEVLGRVRHKNLLGLRGYCAGTDQRLIVYDYMPNLSLLSHLHGQFAGETQLDWKKRMKIAIGSAEGLLYLHHEVTPHIIHRDIKASNVLLDSNFEPLVADFGFAKLIPEGVSHMTTRVKGTLGYLAPEYAMWGKVSESCDVYSFGILLLELLTGRKPIEKLPGGLKRTVTEWAEPLITQGKFKELVDPKLRANFDENQLKQAINVAALCVQTTPALVDEDVSPITAANLMRPEGRQKAKAKRRMNAKMMM